VVVNQIRADKPLYKRDVKHRIRDQRSWTDRLGTFYKCLDVFQAYSSSERLTVLEMTGFSTQSSRRDKVSQTTAPTGAVGNPLGRVPTCVVTTCRRIGGQQLLTIAEKLDANQDPKDEWELAMQALLYDKGGAKRTFPYVTPFPSSGKERRTFIRLNRIPRRVNPRVQPGEYLCPCTRVGLRYIENVFWASRFILETASLVRSTRIEPESKVRILRNLDQIVTKDLGNLSPTPTNLQRRLKNCIQYSLRVIR
jgi:hypothetical protein